MSGGMPYYFEKGALLRQLEDEINGSGEMAIRVLNALRKPERDLWDNFLFRPPVDTETGSAEAAVVSEHEKNEKNEKHFKEHWLGKPANGAPSRTTGAEPPAPSGSSNPEHGCREEDDGKSAQAPPPPTGWWWAYTGQADTILRTTLIRALELALGLPLVRLPLDRAHPIAPIAHDQKLERHWPITLFWVCGHRWFEGWVTWRVVTDQSTGHGADQSTGHVVVLLTTPGFDTPDADIEPMRKRPGLKKVKGSPTPVPVLPVASLPTNEEHGLWLVTQDEHRREWAAPYPKNAGASLSGDWRTPYLNNVDCGPVLILDMADEDDGLTSSSVGANP